MKELFGQGGVDQFIEEIISRLPLKEKASLTNMNKEHIEVLQKVFELYITNKTGSEFDDEEYKDIMDKLWERLRETHRLKIVK